jgi:hypothetical protein
MREGSTAHHPRQADHCGWLQYLAEPLLQLDNAFSNVHDTLACLQVIKIGTSSLINEQYGTLNLSSLSRICEVVRDLHAKGNQTERSSCIYNSKRIC